MQISTLFCSHCKQQFKPTNKRQRFCCANCRAAEHYAPIKLTNEERRHFNDERQFAKCLADRRDESMSFDGRGGGPQNSPYRGNRFYLRLRPSRPELSDKYIPEIGLK